MRKPTKPVNICGRTFGALWVIGYVGIRKGKGHCWLCRCVCKRFGVYSGSRLMNGDRTSCGCRAGIVDKQKWSRRQEMEELVELERQDRRRKANRAKVKIL